MARINDCPRCGAGVSPTDIQCWRCGERLHQAPVKAVPPAWPKGPTGIREAKDIRPTPKPKVERGGLQSLTEMQGGRYKELQDREKELRQEMEAVEKEAMQLDRIATRLQEQEAALQERHRQLDAREDELDALALSIEPALKVVEELHRDGAAVPLEEVMAAGQDLNAVLEAERTRIREEIERDMADQLNRISQLEDGLRAAHAQVREAPVKEGAKSIDVAAAVRQISEQMAAQIEAGPGVPTIDTVRTHIEKLDQVLAGGIPEGSVILLNGPGGSMKTSLAYQVLHSAASKDGIKGMYFSLEQSRGSLLRQMARLGMAREDSLDDLMVVDMVELRRSMEGQQGSWRDIVTRYVNEVMQKSPFQLFVLDSLDSFMAMSEHVFTRPEVQDLFDWLRDLGLTSIVISETPQSVLESNEHTELYVADGALEVVMRETGDLRIQRWIRCVKMRGANIDTRYYALHHQNGAFSLSIPIAGGSNPPPGGPL